MEPGWRCPGSPLSGGLCVTLQELFDRNHLISVRRNRGGGPLDPEPVVGHHPAHLQRRLGALMDKLICIHRASMMAVATARFQ